MFAKLHLGLPYLYAILLLGISGLLWSQTENANLGKAQFNDAGQLLKPANLDQWIHLGSNMGQGYSEDTFDPSSPGTFRIVEMEPSAYNYFKTHGRYADGTMIGLSFYRPQSKTNPRLNGFSQGELVSFEIHLIDSAYADGRAFFNFIKEEQADMIEAGNACVECHREEGEFESTFTQFYPKMQSIIKHHHQ